MPILWGFLIIYIVTMVTIIITTHIENKGEKKEKKRNSYKNVPAMPQEEFDEIVNDSAKGIKRLSEICTVGSTVVGTVQAHSGLTVWHFKLDFSDRGRITGKYQLSSDNEDSIIPKCLGDRIQGEIMRRTKAW